MKVSKREKTMLIVLLGLLILFSYYWFIIKKEEARLTQDKQIASDLQMQQQQIMSRLAVESRLDNEYNNILSELENTAKSYYTEVSHEDIIIQASKFAKDILFNIVKIEFLNSENDEKSLSKVSARVEFVSDYSNLKEYLFNIENHDKVIKVDNIIIRGNDEYGVSGSLTLTFNVIPVLAKYSDKQEGLLSLEDNYKDVSANPFMPFEGFIREEMSFSIEDYLVGETNDYQNYRPKVTVYDFEDENTFFVANSLDISGRTSQSNTRISGGQSTSLEFDFITGRMINEANIVFDGSPVMLYTQAEYLSLWIYAYETGNHSIGAVLIDSSGKEFKIIFTERVNWTGWKELETQMPMEINYPCKVQRIFVEGIGYEQKITGKYLFDKLGVSYPIEQGGSQ